jgi:hypothetical protein
MPSSEISSPTCMLLRHQPHLITKVNMNMVFINKTTSAKGHRFYIVHKDGYTLSDSTTTRRHNIDSSINRV